MAKEETNTLLLRTRIGIYFVMFFSFIFALILSVQVGTSWAKLSSKESEFNKIYQNAFNKTMKDDIKGILNEFDEKLKNNESLEAKHKQSDANEDKKSKENIKHFKMLEKESEKAQWTTWLTYTREKLPFQ